MSFTILLGIVGALSVFLFWVGRRAGQTTAGVDDQLGRYLEDNSHGTDNVSAVANLAMLTGSTWANLAPGSIPSAVQNNVQGACDMGALPDLFPGYQKVSDTSARASFEAAWGVSLPAASIARETLRAIKAAGKGGQDSCSVISVIEALANTTIAPS